MVQENGVPESHWRAAVSSSTSILILEKVVLYALLHSAMTLPQDNDCTMKVKLMFLH
uniref:Uncharacterized protein n=1 Tax=Arion vulgaris TaxID=1028688 RepID=A0A0B7AHY3_9EUPU